MPRRIIRKNRKYAKKRRTSGGLPKRSSFGPGMAGAIVKKSGVNFPRRRDLTYTIPRIGMTGCVPQTLLTQHRYCEEVALTSDNLTGYTGSQYEWRLNSLFDPNLTGVGHQPQGFDQMAAFYNTYRVYKVDVQIRIVASSHADSYVASKVTPYTTVYNLGLKQQAEIQEVANCNCFDAFVGNVAEWKGMYIADIEGQKREAVFNDLLFRAAIGANPATTSIFGLAVGNSSLITGATVKIMVSFVYYAQWSDRVALPQS